MFEEENTKFLLIATKEKNKQLQEYIDSLEQARINLENENKQYEIGKQKHKKQIQDLQIEVENLLKKKIQMQDRINQLASHNCQEEIYKNPASFIQLQRNLNYYSYINLPNNKNINIETNNGVSKSMFFQNNKRQSIQSNKTRERRGSNISLTKFQLNSNNNNINSNYTQSQTEIEDPYLSRINPIELKKQKQKHQEYIGKNIVSLRYSYNGALSNTINTFGSPDKQFNINNRQIHSSGSKEQQQNYGATLNVKSFDDKIFDNEQQIHQSYQQQQSAAPVYQDVVPERISTKKNTKYLKKRYLNQNRLDQTQKLMKNNNSWKELDKILLKQQKLAQTTQNIIQNNSFKNTNNTSIQNASTVIDQKLIQNHSNFLTDIDPIEFSDDNKQYNENDMDYSDLEDDQDMQQSQSDLENQKFYTLRQTEKKKKKLKNSKLGDLLFEDFFVIGPNLKQVQEEAEEFDLIEKQLEYSIKQQKAKLKELENLQQQQKKQEKKNKKNKQNPQNLPLLKSISIKNEPENPNEICKDLVTEKINVNPQIQYRFQEYQNPQEDKYQEMLEYMEQSAFPFGVDVELFNIEIKENQQYIHQEIQKVIYPKPRNHIYNQNSLNVNTDTFNYNQDCFVFNFKNTSSYKNEYDINQVLLSANPNTMNYCMCYKTNDFFIVRNIEDQNLLQKQQELENQDKDDKIKQQKPYKIHIKQKIKVETILKPGNYTVAKFPKVYVFLTFFPFVQFFNDVLKSISNALQIKNIQQLMQTSYQGICNVDFSQIKDLFKQEKNVQALLEQMQTSVPEFSKLLYFSVLKEKFSSPTNQWVPPVSSCPFLEAEWGTSLVVSNFSFEDFWFVICSIMQEQHIIFVSENQAVLSATIMSFQALIKPFIYSYPLIFNLTQERISILESPFPIMMGINLSINDLYNLTIDEGLEVKQSIFIDLDNSCNFYFGCFQNPFQERMELIKRINIARFPAQIASLIENYYKINNSKVCNYKKPDNSSTQKQLEQKNPNKSLLFNPTHDQLNIITEIIYLMHECFKENIVKYIPSQPIFENEQHKNFYSCSDLPKPSNKSFEVNSENNLVQELNEIKIEEENQKNTKKDQEKINKYIKSKRVLNYKKIKEIIINNNPKEKEFLKNFMETQIFTFYIEQMYQIQEELLEDMFEEQNLLYKQQKLSQLTEEQYED